MYASSAAASNHDLRMPQKENANLADYLLFGDLFRRIVLVDYAFHRFSKVELFSEWKMSILALYVALEDLCAAILSFLICSVL